MSMKEFFTQFAHDWKRIIWPTRGDVVSSFVMTIILAFVFGLFFLFVDRFVSLFINYLLAA